MRSKLGWLLVLSLPLALMGCGKETITEADSIESQLKQAQKENPGGNEPQSGKRSPQTVEQGAAAAPPKGEAGANPNSPSTD